MRQYSGHSNSATIKAGPHVSNFIACHTKVQSYGQFYTRWYIPSDSDNSLSEFEKKKVGFGLKMLHVSLH